MKFSRQHRLRTKAEFQYVFSHPEVTRDRYFRVFRRANGRGFNRLGMAVSRRNCRTAVGRSRLKRVIRESFRRFAEASGSARGFDFVVLPTGQAASICNETLFDSLEMHWNKAPGKDRGGNETEHRNEP